MADERTRADSRGWALWIVAILVGLSGLFYAIGGFQLFNLGGSPYYLVAGLALLACAVLLIIRSPIALFLMGSGRNSVNRR